MFGVGLSFSLSDCVLFNLEPAKELVKLERNTRCPWHSDPQGVIQCLPLFCIAVKTFVKDFYFFNTDVDLLHKVESIIIILLFSVFSTENLLFRWENCQLSTLDIWQRLMDRLWGLILFIQFIHKMSQDKKVYNNIINSLFPTIHGNDSQERHCWSS